MCIPTTLHPDENKMVCTQKLNCAPVSQLGLVLPRAEHAPSAQAQAGQYQKAQTCPHPFTETLLHRKMAFVKS